VEAFNNILEHVLTNVCNIRRDHWKLMILVVLWAYKTRSKKLEEQTPFILVYGQEIVTPMECIVSSLQIVVLSELIDFGAMEKRLLELVEMDEDRFVAGLHQQV